MKPLKDFDRLDFEMCADADGNTCYRLLSDIVYTSHRYGGKTVTCFAGENFDGATGATDIVSKSWFVHDKVCKTHKWDDGTECTNLQRSYILHDILMKEGRWFRAHSWFIATYAWGWLKEWWADEPKHPTNGKIDPTKLPIAFA